MQIKKIIIIWLILSISLALVGEVDLNRLKAAYIEKFTRFIEWPENDDNVFMVGYFYRDQFIEELQDYLKETNIHNKHVEFLLIDRSDKILDCNLIYIPSQNDEELEQTLRLIENKPILSISQSNRYAKKGVHINFYLRGDKLKFEINGDAAKQSDLKISHLLLQLAKVVHSGGQK